MLGDGRNLHEIEYMIACLRKPILGDDRTTTEGWNGIVQEVDDATNEILWKRTTEGHRQREQGEYEVGDLSLRLEALKYQDYGI